MKTFTLFLFILLSVFKLQAQDYQISFAGTGESTTVDAVTVENKTQGKSISLLGSETLHLLAIVTGNAPILDNVDFPLHIYPNPSSDYFTIEFGARKSGLFTVRLFDLIGKEIANLKQTLSSGINSFRISGVNYGIYTIKVDIDNQSYSGKLISQGSSNSKLTISYIGNNVATQADIKLKNATTERFWQYTTGDILSFTGTSGKFSTVIEDVPTKSKILTFNFTTPTPVGEVIYYGISAETIVTAEYILANFKKTTGPVGSPFPNGRLYTFPPDFNTYRFWAIPDQPNTGDRVIQSLTASDGITVIGLQPGDTFYTYYQYNPTPPAQSLQYGKLEINGLTYRLYRTTLKYTASRTQFIVYSF